MTPEAFQRWQSMRGPESRWRQDARAVIIRVVREQRDLGKLDDDAALLKAVDAAYPFGERNYLPYKMWLLERRLFRDACTVPPPAPSREEAEVCSVARDLVELGRIDEARKLVEEQAPYRVTRDCPACGALAGDPCVDFEYEDPPVPGYGQYPTGQRWLIVPHHARLVGHNDAGPLFEAR